MMKHEIFLEFKYHTPNGFGHAMRAPSMTTTPLTSIFFENSMAEAEFFPEFPFDPDVPFDPLLPDLVTRAEINSA
jgi:hypothetical protein